MADILSPNTEVITTLKSEINYIPDANLINNDQINTEQFKKENKDNNEHIDNTNSINDRDSITENENNYLLTNGNQNLSISIRKMEDLCSTPNNCAKLNKSLDSRSIKIENTNSPETFSLSEFNSPTIDWFSQSAKSLSDTPNKRKRKRISTDISDYDRLSDTFKSELLHNPMTDMEAIDMLHDLNSVIDFEDTKIPSFCSIYNDIQNTNNTEMCQDPQVDPLLIANNDECNVKTENIEVQQIKQEKNINTTPKRLKIKKDNTPKQKESNRYNFRQANSNSENFSNDKIKENRNIKPKPKRQKKDHHTPVQLENSKKNIEQTISDDEDLSDEAYNTIKDVLEVLDIESDTENDELEKNSIKKLYDLEIKLLHEVPPQHKIETTAGSKSLTRMQKLLFSKFGPLKKGVFSPNEDNIIKKNWQSFCKVHNLNPKHVQPFLRMRQNNKYYIRTAESRQMFVQFLANGLPWRSLYSVYNRFKYLYTEHKNTFQRFTLAEDEQILKYMQTKKRGRQKKHHHKFMELSKILDRTKQSIRARYILLKRTEVENSEPLDEDVKWTLPLIGRFIKTLMSVTLCDEVEDLKDATIPKPVWLKIAETIKIRYNLLNIFWIHQLHMQLFCPEPIYLNDVKIKLIEYFYGKGYSNTREIIWPNVAKYFEGFTTIFLCKLFCYLVQEATAKVGTRDLPVVLEYLYEEKIRNIKNELTDKYLPRLSYNKGKVQVIDEIERTDTDSEDVD